MGKRTDMREHRSGAPLAAEHGPISQGLQAAINCIAEEMVRLCLRDGRLPPLDEEAGDGEEREPVAGGL